jgi:hypothetical protein
VGGYNYGDPGPIHATKTYLKPSELILVAREEDTVFLELRTAGDHLIRIQ